MAVTTAEKPRSRSKLTKALVATGVGVALLAGGGGTFAAWSSKAEVTTGTSVSSGELNFGALGEGSWTNVMGAPVTKEALATGAYKVVPGDALTYTQTVTVNASGNLLVGHLSTNLDKLVVRDVAGANGSLAGQLRKAATLTVNQVKQPGLTATIKPTGEAQTVVAAVTVTFDEATAGLMAQNATVDLSNLEILLEQQPVSRSNG